MSLYKVLKPHTNQSIRCNTQDVKSVLPKQTNHKTPS